MPVPTAWREHIGEYELLNPDQSPYPVDELRLAERDGFLVLEYRVPQMGEHSLAAVLRPLDDNEAVVAGLGRGKGDAVRAFIRDGTEIIAYSGFEMTKRKP